MKDLSGVNICVWIEILKVLLKIWLAYPLFCCTCVFDICLQWSCFWHGSGWRCRWVCGGSFGMSGVFRHKLNLKKKNWEIFYNYIFSRILKVEFLNILV